MSENANTKQKGKGNLLKIIIIVLLSLIIIGGGVFAGFLIAGKMSPSNNADNQTSVPEVKQKMFHLEEFLVNIKSDSSRSRYLAVTMDLSYADVEDVEIFEEELEAKKPIIRHNIIEVLRNQNYEDLMNKNSDSLREEIINILNDVVKEGQLLDIYFTKYMIQ